MGWFGPRGECGACDNSCASFSWTLFNTEHFTESVDGKVFTSVQGLGRPDMSLVLSLSEKTVETGPWNRPWLYDDGRWIQVELVSNPGVSETVHFVEKYQFLRLDDWHSGSPFDDPKYDVFREHLNDTEGTAPRDWKVQMTYATGTLGTYVVFDRYDNEGGGGDWENHSSTDQPVIEEVSMVVRPQYITTGRMTTPQSLTGVPNEFTGGVGKGGAFFREEFHFPTELRLDSPLPSGMHFRVSFSHEKLGDETLAWKTIDNVTRSRDATCTRVESCAASPMRSPPRYKIKSLSAGGTASVTAIAVDKHYNNCNSSQAMLLPDAITPLSIDLRTSQYQWQATYTRGGVDRVVYRDAVQEKMYDTVSDSAVVTPQLSIACKVIAIAAATGYVKLRLQATPTRWMPVVDGFGATLVSSTATTNRYKLNETYMSANGGISSESVSAGWDSASFGAADPASPVFPPTMTIEGQTHNIVPGSEKLSTDIGRTYTEVKTTPYSLWGIFTGPTWAEYEKTIPIWSGFDPPEVRFTGSDITYSPGTFNVLKSVSLEPGIPDSFADEEWIEWNPTDLDATFEPYGDPPFPYVP